MACRGQLYFLPTGYTTKGSARQQQVFNGKRKLWFPPVQILQDKINLTTHTNRSLYLPEPDINKHLAGCRIRISAGTPPILRLYVVIPISVMQILEHFLDRLRLVCFFLGNSQASESYTPTFRNTLFHLHRQVGRCTYLPMKMKQSVPKRWHITSRCRGITQKKAYDFRTRQSLKSRRLRLPSKSLPVHNFPFIAHPTVQAKYRDVPIQSWNNNPPSSVYRTIF